MPTRTRPASPVGPGRRACAGRAGRAPFSPGPAAHARRSPLAARRSPPAAVAWLGTCAPGASATRPCIPPEHLAPGHDGALLRPPGHHLHHVLGRHRHRRALVRAEGTQPRSDHHHAGCHGCLLLPLLAHRHPGSAEPPVWTAAEERDHLVRALPVGVTSPRCLSSLDDPGSMSLMTPPSLPSPHSCKVLSAGT